MKKILLLLAGGFVAVSANAQYSRTTASAVFNHATKMPAATSSVAAPAGIQAGARTTATAFVTENFGSGSTSSLPAGWTTGAITTGTWKWTNAASTSTFSMGAMTSTTAANGWMIFDSDDIGAACSCAPAGWLQSPAYNCSSQPYVRLNFENYYRKFQDSCFVWVSTSPTFSTYTSFPVIENNTRATNTSTANPSTVHINISSVAGGQAAVYIRFVTYGPDLGAYSWMIDDMTLSDLDPIDIGLDKSTIVYYTGSDGGYYSFGSMPSKMADTVHPITFVSNYGYTAQPSVAVNAKIFQGTSNVYTANVNVNAPVNALDSVADFTAATPSYYYSNTVGGYTVPFSVNPASDAVTSNNLDTFTYSITDSVWSQNAQGRAITGSSYIYRPGPNVMSYSTATMFSVPAGQSDTLTSVSVAFGRATKPGQTVGVQIFHFDGVNWVFDGVTQFRALAAGEISTATTTTWATFMVDEVATIGKVVLEGGTGGRQYAAVVKGSSNTDTVTVLESEVPAPSFIIGGSHSGLADTSENDGSASQQFGQGGLPYYIETTPLINMNFGTVIYNYTGISSTSGNAPVIGKAYPNPANTSSAVPFTMASDAVVTVSLSDVAGRMIGTYTMNVTAGQPARAIFETNGLANGVYIYTIEANGQRKNGRIAVTH